MTDTGLRALLLGVAAAAVFAEPAAATAVGQSATAFAVGQSATATTIGQSTTVELIDSLNLKLLYVAVPITILVEGILLYTVLVFKDSEEPKPTKENRRLEITWTVATAVVLMFVGVASIGVLANDSVTYTGGEVETEGVEVTAEAFQWNWNMSYPNENIDQLSASDLDVAAGDASGPVIVLPVDRPAYVTVTSRDVIHALHVPGLGLKQDAVPGQANTIRTTPTETGVYQGYCAEFCGAGHSQMYFEIVVVEQDTYEQFLANQGDDGEVETGASVATNTTTGNTTSDSTSAVGV